MIYELVPEEPRKVELFLDGHVLRGEFNTIAKEITSKKSPLIELVTQFDRTANSLAVIPEEIVSPWFGGVRLKGRRRYLSATEKLLQVADSSTFIKTGKITSIVMQDGSFINVTGTCKRDGKTGIKGIRLGLMSPGG